MVSYPMILGFGIERNEGVYNHSSMDKKVIMRYEKDCEFGNIITQ